MFIGQYLCFMEEIQKILDRLNVGEETKITNEMIEDALLPMDFAEYVADYIEPFKSITKRSPITVTKYAKDGGGYVVGKVLPWSADDYQWLIEQVEQLRSQGGTHSIEIAGKLHSGFVREWARNREGLSWFRVSDDALVVTYGGSSENRSDKLNAIIRGYTKPGLFEIPGKESNVRVSVSKLTRWHGLPPVTVTPIGDKYLIHRNEPEVLLMAALLKFGISEEDLGEVLEYCENMKA